MNYKIIIDEQRLRDFIDWLPALEKHETYYCCLMARNKYVRDDPKFANLVHVKTDKAQLKRFTSDKERLFDKIKQLECEFGSYVQKGSVIPQEALALYINPNPRDMEKAAKASVKKLLDLILMPYNGYNPHQEVMSEIQRSKSKSDWIDFDFDLEIVYDADIPTKRFDAVLGSCAYRILRTRGGFHLLVDPNAIAPGMRKHWYKDISNMPNVDVRGDNMIPVPGCVQGNFSPYFIK